MLSRQHGFIFVHIPKTGGNSIARALRSYADDIMTTDRPRQDGEERFGLGVPGTKLSKHSTLAEYELEIGASVVAEYLVFATIRDPWSRALSYYFSPHAGRTTWDREEFLRLMETMRPSVEYLTTRQTQNPRSVGELGADVLLRFDHLSQDFTRLSEQLGLDVQLPHVNASQHSRDVRGLLDRELMGVIAEHFLLDIEVFGFLPPGAAKRT